VSYPPHLLDELARIFARVALERLLQELAARELRQEDASGDSGEVPSPSLHGVDDEKKHG
jgi:hypothetical protein